MCNMASFNGIAASENWRKHLEWGAFYATNSFNAICIGETAGP